MASRREPTKIRVIGATRAPIRDFYHNFLRAPWWAGLLAIVSGFLLMNVGYAWLYVFIGGVQGARPRSFVDAFYFSVQTMGTIGYGAMYPASTGANVLVVSEAVVGLLVTAVSTGLVFSKFSQSTARVLFTREACVSLMDGVPTLSFRISNERGNQIVEAQLHVTLMRTETTAEGMTFYRMHDLPLSRGRSPAFTRSWLALHPITPKSLLHGQTPASLKEAETEILVTLVGTDDTSLQPVHARHNYSDDEIIWGARHADILTEKPDGLLLDLTRFHDLTFGEPTPEFPYPEPAKPVG